MSKLNEIFKTDDGELFFVIDWSEIRDEMLRVMDGKPRFLSGRNAANARAYFYGDASAKFIGYKESELRGWIERGYKVDSLRNIGNPPIKLRDKRRLRFDEEGDEFHYDLAIAGDDKPFSEMPRIQSVPGLGFEATICFVNRTPTSLIESYLNWMARAAYSLEAAGIDLEVNFRFRSERVWNPHYGICSSLVRVKREGERTDYSSWSPMLSPAGYRGFGFLAEMLGAQSGGYYTDRSMGHGVNKNTPWSVSYDPDRRAIVVLNPYIPTDFPAMDMTDQLRDALSQVK
jgi:hypothetical protein